MAHRSGLGRAGSAVDEPPAGDPPHAGLTRRPGRSAIPGTFLACTEKEFDEPFLRFTVDASAKTQRDPTWDHRELPTDHGLTDTDALVEILLDIGH